MTDNSRAVPDSNDHQPARRNMSDRARATRSFRLAQQLTGDAQRDALRAHFGEFASARTCPVRKF